MSVPVFMYHAVYDSIDLLIDADPFYAVSFETFIKQVELCKINNKPVKSIANVLASSKLNKTFCVFTFDDGHISNYKAAKILNQYGYTADFFINSANIGKNNFLDNRHIQEMMQWGMSIQSHGHEHFYISDLSDEDATRQLLQSKEIIEKITQQTVNIFAPPGGRINTVIEGIAFKLGYIAIANSKPGVWNDISNTSNIPRLPILNTTDISMFEKWLCLDPLIMFKLYLNYQLKKTMKIVLGNGSYEKLRAFLLSVKS
jgi:peptidoglycan/xylan/chitin deacetylase (PgdA/CDA1 family)